MQKLSFHRRDTSWFSKQQLELVYEQSALGSFLQEPFSEEALLRQAERKGNTFSAEQRLLLVQALESQYSKISLSDATKTSIESLKQGNTFTITTGHQLSLFTGPLYFVIKILHVIKMCEELNARHPEFHFVPVYWMATEDHDFEEIRSFNIFNRTVEWKTEQAGPVGLFELDGLQEIREQMHELFGNNPESEIHEIIEVLNGENYAEAMRKLVDRLFADRGLVIIDGDDPVLKKSFLPVFEKELTAQFSKPEVDRTTEELVKKGYKAQVIPREINLFYSEKGIRSRIEQDGENYSAEGLGTVSVDGLLKSPEKISPNVILRPVYQEHILPNLLYVGGAGEISYWLQLKGVFDAAGVLYPLIQVRNSVLWLDRGVLGKLEKVEGTPSDIFRDEHEWKKTYLNTHGGDDLDMSRVDTAFEQFTQEMKNLILSIDHTKDSFLNAELTRMEKQVEGLKSKAVKFSKSNHDQAMKAIEFIKGRVNPAGGLQERSVNFFQFCNSGEVAQRINDLYDALVPFNGDLIVILENS